LKFLKGGDEAADLEKDQFMSLCNILNQNEYPKKIKMTIFEKHKILNEYSRKVDFEKFMQYFSEKEVEFFEFMRLLFANNKYC